MSTSYNAYVIFGVRLTVDDLTVRSPHPLWGVHKFDPNNGKKVTQFIEERVYGDDIIDAVESWIVEEADLVSILNNREDAYYIGQQLAELGLWNQEKPFADLDSVLRGGEEEGVKTTLRLALQKKLPDLVVTDDMFKKYVVLVVS